MHEWYGGKDQVQVASGSGMSISHIGHSKLAGTNSLLLKNVLHVPNISKHLHSVHKLVPDNPIFIEFHPDLFFVKDKATRKTILHGRSRGGLYPIPFGRAASSHHDFSGVKVSSQQWHESLGHPSNKVVKSVLRHNNLPCASNVEPSICDACQRAKSHQLPYNNSTRVSSMPLELIHTDVWGPALPSSEGFKY